MVWCSCCVTHTHTHTHIHKCCINHHLVFLLCLTHPPLSTHRLPRASLCFVFSSPSCRSTSRGSLHHRRPTSAYISHCRSPSPGAGLRDRMRGLAICTDSEEKPAFVVRKVGRRPPKSRSSWFHAGFVVVTIQGGRMSKASVHLFGRAGNSELMGSNSG